MTRWEKKYLNLNLTELSNITFFMKSFKDTNIQNKLCFKYRIRKQFLSNINDDGGNNKQKIKKTLKKLKIKKFKKLQLGMSHKGCGKQRLTACWII